MTPRDSARICGVHKMNSRYRAKANNSVFPWARIKAFHRHDKTAASVEKIAARVGPLSDHGTRKFCQRPNHKQTPCRAARQTEKDGTIGVSGRAALLSRFALDWRRDSDGNLAAEIVTLAAQAWLLEGGFHHGDSSRQHSSPTRAR
jgi:hypothetical protein